MLSEEFVENVAKKAIKMANHRGSPIVEAKDIKFCLGKTLFDQPTALSIIYAPLLFFQTTIGIYLFPVFQR